MFTTYTYQDYLAAEDKIALLCKAIEKFKASAEFVRALSASSASVAAASASSSGTAGSHIMPRYTASASSSSVPTAPMTK